tara:strand:- start:406 stop:840 length:435 start_codon:yes stop_codon:yes gene_type:complete
MVKKEIKTLFQWLEEITVKKSPPTHFTDDSWNSFTPFLIHRYISMNEGYVEVANLLQKMEPTNKVAIYLAYSQLLPKKKLWLKYIKNQNSSKLKLTPSLISKYFECSTREAKDYIKLLPKETTQSIFESMGIEGKELKKLIKEI